MGSLNPLTQGTSFRVLDNYSSRKSEVIVRLNPLTQGTSFREIYYEFVEGYDDAYVLIP